MPPVQVTENPIDVLEQGLTKVDVEETYKDWKRGNKKFVDLNATEKQIFYIYRAEQHVIKVQKVFQIFQEAHDAAVKMHQEPDLSDDELIALVAEVAKYKANLLRVSDLREKAVKKHFELIDAALTTNKDDAVLVRDLTQYRKRCESNYIRANIMRKP